MSLKHIFTGPRWRADPKAGPLELCNAQGTQPYHVLVGRLVKLGDILQVQLGGVWVRGSYECAMHPRCPVVFLHAIGGRICPDRDALYRWPAPS